MRTWTSALAALVAAGMGSGVLGAQVNLSFFNITNNGNQNVGSQLQVTASDVAGQPTKVDFLFKNFVGIASSIKEVYFDAGAIGTIFTTGSIQSQAGASFVWGSGSPGELPGGAALQPVFETTLNLLTDSGSGGPSTGLNASSDSLVVRMTLASGKTFGDVVNGLLANPASANSIRVGMHVISIGTVGGSDSYVSNLLVVPLPPAAWAGLTCLAGVIGAGMIRTRWLTRRS